MRISVSITNFSWPGAAATIADELERVVRRADEGHIDTVWVCDHLLQLAPGTQPTQEMLEAYTTLGYLAAITGRVRLGTMVTAATFRTPTLLLKAVTTVDVLSGGRAWLGIGAGYHQPEATMMGLFLPSTTERFERLEETLQLALRMWEGQDTAFAGDHFHAERPINSPNAISTPHPPILIAGSGEHRTLRLVAQYAQACNLYDAPDNGRTITRKLRTLAEHCATLGRPSAAIEKTVNIHIHPTDTLSDLYTRAEAFNQLGIDHLIVMKTAAPWTTENLDTINELARQVEHLHPAGDCP
ncbi:TIGR03560 family F420-dependent LLM class oxidoreductase [Nocardia sp. NEAU-G5]|uniref:TIGR03560 family F420-dependent LLM class oxidoreductase n=1 Tax=Nocardia albiluteola TaxID=2842303 RepID=A0ABS6BA03_9NOCA|nr:TIGR03560 family F420-dependent LLM class oxidoreductase [Nocardia albiluteola]MBU3066600.1 TIGR03560 family F420-dependent LLM class oxidoreductase [Nocardia albiluteola]